MPEDQTSERTGTLVQSESPIADITIRWQENIRKAVVERTPGHFEAHSAADVKVPGRRPPTRLVVMTGGGPDEATARKNARLAILEIALDLADGTA